MKTTLVASAAVVGSLLGAADAAPALPQWLRKSMDKLIENSKRQDWGAINYDFSGVNWNTVSYDFNNVDWNTVNYNQPAAATPAAAAPTPAAVAAQATPVTVQTQAAAVIPVVAATTAAAAAIPVATQPSVVATSNSGKRGLGWDPTSNPSYASKFGGKVSWYFNWSPTPSAGLPSSWEFFANIWGSGGIENLANTLQGKPKLIGFNEPDSPTQANIPVGQAISLYKQYLTGLKGQGKISQLGTPAVTNSVQAGQGLQYLQQFVAGCADCGLDFAVVHWYSNSIDDFKNFVTAAHTLTGLPVNVAEFAYTTWSQANEPSDAQVKAFLDQATAWLDAQSFVTKYAWFGSMYVSEAKYPSLGAANSLVSADLTSLTAIGADYSN